MILLPGVQGFRSDRSSRLAFAWDARDRTLLARSGQQGVLSAIAGAAQSITPGYGPAVTGGFAQPRYGRIGGSAGAAVLDLDGSTAGAQQQQLLYPFSMGPASLTLFLRLTPLWAAGSSRASTTYVFSLGNSAVGPDRLRVARITTAWQATRSTAGFSTAVSTPESGSAVFPLDLLVTYNHANGATSIQTRDAALALSTPGTLASGTLQSGRWAGGVLALGSDAELRLGAPIRLHLAKLAIGAVLTFADMDLLA